MAKKHVLFKKCKSILAMGFLPIIKDNDDQYCVVTSAVSAGDYLNISGWHDGISEAIHERYDDTEGCSEQEFDGFEDDEGCKVVDCIYSALKSNFPSGTEVEVFDLGTQKYIIMSTNGDGDFLLASFNNPSFTISRRPHQFKPVVDNTTQKDIDEAMKLLTRAGVIKDGKIISL